MQTLTLKWLLIACSRASHPITSHSYGYSKVRYSYSTYEIRSTNIRNTNIFLRVFLYCVCTAAFCLDFRSAKTRANNCRSNCLVNNYSFSCIGHYVQYHIQHNNEMQTSNHEIPTNSIIVFLFSFWVSVIFLSFDTWKYVWNWTSEASTGLVLECTQANSKWLYICTNSDN
jgi:hypothetical protein